MLVILTLITDAQPNTETRQYFTEGFFSELYSVSPHKLFTS